VSDTNGWRAAVARFDQRADEILEPLRGNPAADHVFRVASHLGDWSLLWHLTGAGRGLLDDARADEAFRLSATLGVESLIVNQGLKRLFRRTRPDGHADGLVQYGLRTPTTSSFPSGHASSALCAAVLLSRGGRSRTTPLWIALAGAVGLSRVVVRAHHASDVVGGAVVGTVLGLAARQVWRLPER
jgi:membrane-associated phospholipid phosphatase